MSVSVCLSVTEVHWRIIANCVSNSDPNLPRIAVAVHAGGREGRDNRREEWRDHLVLCKPPLGLLVFHRMAHFIGLCYASAIQPSVFPLARLLPTALAREVTQSLRLSVRLSVCLSVRFHSLNLWIEWPLTLTFCMLVGHDHSSRRIKCQGQR